jgi:Domain of unknown function (DUF6249)
MNSSNLNQKIMKNTSSLFLTFVSYLTALGAILFLVFATLPLCAQTATSAEIGTNNAPASNVIAAAESKAQKPSNESSPIRIDETGVHVGGQNPEHNRKPAFGEDSLGALALLIPIIATSAPFIMVISIIAIVFYFRHRRNKMAHETLRAMIEKGMPVTPELIASLKSRGIKNGETRSRGAGRLLVGLILVGVGIGVVAMMGKAGLIPLFIGVAFLIVWLVERKDINNGQPPKQ